MAAKPNRRKSAAKMDQARQLVERGEWAKARDLLLPLIEAGGAWAEAYGALADALRHLDEGQRAHQVLTRGLEQHPDEPSLMGRMGSLLVDLNRPEEGVRLLERAKRGLERAPAFWVHLGFAKMRTGRLDQAWAAGETALKRGAQDEARLLLASVKYQQGEYGQARTMAQALEQRARAPAIRAAATSIHASAQLSLGDPQGAIEKWKALRSSGQLQSGQWASMAHAAELAGERPLADELIETRVAAGASAEDRLIFAQIQNLRGQPALALQHLEAAEAAVVEHSAGFRYDASATRGRALRLLGKAAEALAELSRAAAMPQYVLPRMGARVRVDLGHLAAEAGDFERAAVLFGEALQLDPGDPEASRALELTRRKVAWRSELKADAQAQVAAARAEAQAQERRFVARDAELAELRRELDRVRAARARAEAAAAAAQHQVKELLTAGPPTSAKLLAEELAARERECEAKADEAVDRALGEGRSRCPPGLLQPLTIAERTFQKALYSGLPAAALAVLFSGALEQGLVSLVVAPFQAWLDAAGRRRTFLQGAVRERVGRRREFFDRFVEAFEGGSAARPPALGELGRALSRRHEPYLKPFHDFLQGRFELPEPMYEAVVELIAWSKRTLRDPAAHGRGTEIRFEDLKRFREELLFDFSRSGRGLWATLLGAIR